MTRTVFAIPAVLAALILGPDALASPLCRAETAAIVAEIRANGNAIYSTDELELARHAALTMCKRIGKADQPTTTAEPDEATSADEEDTLFGIPVGSSERTRGHKRLQRR